MARLLSVVAAAGLVAAVACASTGQRPGDSGGGDENLITAAELRASQDATLLDYIRAHRPRWLQRSYAPVFNEAQVQTVMVFLDNMVHGGPDVLATFSTRSAAEVRYYTPSEAEARFGVGYINGVIQIVSTVH